MISRMYLWCRREEIPFRIILTVISNYCSVSGFGTGYNMMFTVNLLPVWKKKRRGFPYFTEKQIYALFSVWVCGRMRTCTVPGMCA